MSTRHSRSRAPTPGDMGGPFGFNVLDQLVHWDEATTKVVIARLNPSKDFQFFSESEQPTVRSLCDILLGQENEPKVPVVELLDHRLSQNLTDGWHYGDMPEDGHAWHETLVALDKDAFDCHGQAFSALTREQQSRLVQSVHDAETWHEMRGNRVWSLWTRYTSTAFYSHPWAWNEIGFDGPAFPRGYKALGVDKRESWEVRDDHGDSTMAFAERVARAKRRQRRFVARNGKNE